MVDFNIRYLNKKDIFEISDFNEFYERVEIIMEQGQGFIY